MKVDLLRPQTLWPFPSEAIREAAKRAGRVLVVEMSMGQMVEDVRLAVGGAVPVEFFGRPGGAVPMPGEILATMERVPERRPKHVPILKLKKKIKKSVLYRPPLKIFQKEGRHETGQSPPRIPHRKPRLTYCSGCGHGLAHRLVAEVLDELGVRERTVGVAPVGCAVFAYDYWNFDVTEAPHGRTPCVAAGIKRVLPDRVVFSYQGDGDLASIGMGEIVHTANRGDNITVVFINNANYGMTGGQMAPTTPLGMKTTTTPLGRSMGDGHPIRIPELLNALDSPVYLDRQSLHDPGARPEGQGLLEKGVPVPSARQGLRPGGTAVGLPGQLGHDTRRTL